MALKQPKELHDWLKFETIQMEWWIDITPEEQRQMHLEDLNDELENVHLYISDPDVFWPYLRDAINIIMLWMNDENKKKHTTFLHALADILPCWECSKHFKEFLKFNPVDTQSRLRYAQFIMKLHNQVNTRNDKQEWNITQYVDYLYSKYSLAIIDDNDETEEETNTL